VTVQYSVQPSNGVNVVYGTKFSSSDSFINTVTGYVGFYSLLADMYSNLV
jgi:hypothetical protein